MSRVLKGTLLGVTIALSVLPPGARGEDVPFVDRAAESGLDFVHFNGMSGELYFLETMGSGGALVDYDNDGDLDVYLVQGAMLGPGKTLADAIVPPVGPTPPSDRLFRNDSEGGELVFVDVTERSGIEATGYGMGVAAGDYDADGWVDLYLTNFGSNQLLRNRGDGTFEDTTMRAGVDDVRWTVPAAFVDYDRDGLLDLFLANYVDFTFSRRVHCSLPTGAPDYCAPLSYRPVPDRLLRNRGDGTFEDATRRSGIDSAFGNGLGVVTADFDGDGWIDVYVANDMMPNQMWINQGDGTFRDDGLIAGSAVNAEGQPEASMGVVVGDVDADGDLDLFMTHLQGETNTLYLSDGQGGFTDETRRSGLGQASWTATSFGTAWIDIENDGWLDLIVVNGAVSTIEALVRAGDPYPLHQPNQLFRNLGAGRFEEISAATGELFGLSEVSRGVALGDVDNDGDSDVLLANNAGPARLLINQRGQDAAWLGVRLLAGSGSDALGARVTVARAAGTDLERRVQVDGSYASSSDPRVLVGLGREPTVDRLELVWPDGRRRRWIDPELGRYAIWPAPGAAP